MLKNLINTTMIMDIARKYIGALLGVSFTVAVAEPTTLDGSRHESCLLAYIRSEYKKAASLCAGVDDQSNVAKQIMGYVNGEMFAYGRGVEIDDKIAFQHYLGSARAGYPPSQLVVGHYFQTGGGSTIDLTESLQWYLRAGSKNWEGAAYSLSLAAKLLKERDFTEISYRCLYASILMGYDVGTNELRAELSNEIKSAEEKKVKKWLNASRPFSLTNPCALP